MTENLEPQEVFSAFSRISAIPRCSKDEARVLAFIKGLAEARGLPMEQDPTGNLLVSLPPTPGREKVPGVIIQGHVDMVCEKTRDSAHDFSCQGLDLMVDGPWLRARGTSLGADNGIAVAMMIALMEGSQPHGPVDLLFTVDEETGLTGALNLQPSFLRHDLLINIDSEEEESIYIGCAGGIETEGLIPLTRQARPRDHQWHSLVVEGLNGGHSGADIDKFRANALVLMGQLLHRLLAVKGWHLGSVQGGDKHNVIPREAVAYLVLDPQGLVGVGKEIEGFRQAMAEVWGDREPGLRISLSASGVPSGQVDDTVLAGESRDRLVSFMRLVPHGVQAMSRHIDGLVSTSTNFASIRVDTAGAHFLSSQRSDSWFALHEVQERVALALALAGGSSRQTNEYPGWTPDPHSPFLALAKDVYRRVHGREALIKSIHAGLETGVIGARRPGIRMISCGPDIQGAHSPQERLDIASTGRVWAFVCALLEALQA